ncbi:MAG: 4-hydroxy-3-methylbut-2-enyl diphosphate reductase [Clostridiales bacterium]|jgi:4-hydroxy-3-methylbut-2-enyl diphosphate reductase|nr:4-hydroxy-3-methylbut-2-enyl diphosphate reductase [Clostridiales bacterium]
MSKQIIIAENAGFCFGVKRAVEMTVDTNKDKKSKVYTLGPLIHNKDVVESLKDQGINPIDNDHFRDLSAEDTVVIRSHGVSSDILEEIKKTGASIVDATCPYVTSIQRKARKYYSEGYLIVIVGDPKHPEVIGINGWCDNTAIITKTGEELRNLPDKVCVLSQTTEKQVNYEKTLEAVSKLSQDVLAFNTICSATKERQESAYSVSKKADLMVVIGGKNSSNTKKLYEICSENCENTILIENVDEIPDNLITDSNLKIIGVTAGASTPEWIISEVIGKLS